MKLCALLQINQEDGDIVEPGKKKKSAQQAQLPRSKLCRLSGAIHEVEKVDKIGKTSQRAGACMGK